ncbi:hypothetical protein FSP39_005287 [Pinctada imbricata]|uniref:B box-type domain-containing protein n=1 Tax=Pinctada imbricata TaxID=66713 RepID=A0AA88YAR3_PINIB|nr:hypothetical protein FSP39_005287 [Pinctada imbricata]
MGTADNDSVYKGSDFDGNVSLDSLNLGSDYDPVDPGVDQVPPTPTVPCCQEHSHNKVQMYCNKCDIMVCTECVIGAHNGHKFSDLTKAASKKKLILKKHMLNISKTDCVELEEKLTKVRERKSENLRQTNETKDSLLRKGDELKEKVDRIVQGLVRKLSIQGKLNDDVLGEAERNIEERLCIRRSLAEACNTAFNSNDPVEIIQQEKTLKHTVQSRKDDGEITVPNLMFYDFIPGNVAEENIKEQIGELSEEMFIDTDFKFV